MKNFKLLLATSLTLATGLSFGSVDVIYGDDNRKDVFESTDAVMVRASLSTAGMVPASNIKITGNTATLSGKRLKDLGICDSERFATQITAASCSGFLIAPDVFVTAGHCITSAADCSNFKWVFDYKMGSAGQRTITVPKTSIYSCSKILARTLDPSSKDDYAVIRLDRRVSGRTPLKMRTKGRISAGEDVVVIGHPSGLPTKISDNAQVRSLQGKYFVANLDTYGGNSGSAVLNARTGEVEGILVRGENDYVPDTARGCQISNRCNNTGCRGEDVTYITNLKGI